MKKKKSGNETILFLPEKAESEKALREEELQYDERSRNWRRRSWLLI